MALVLYGLPAIPGEANPPSSTVIQQWDLLAGSRVDSVSATIDIERGPYGGLYLDPMPSVEFVAVGYVVGAGAGGAWDVELRGDSNELLGTIRFESQDDELVLKSVDIPWPVAQAELDSLKLVKFGSPVNPGGTLHLTKAYLRLTQEGTIMSTRGRVPLMAAQPVSTTSWTDVTEPILYQHFEQGFDPAATALVRVGGKAVSYPFSSSVRMVDGSGAPVSAEMEFFGTNYASWRSAVVSLDEAETYRLQAKTSQTGWGILSADIEFQQSTTDPGGLSSVVAWYPATTTPTTLATDGQRTEHLMEPVANDVEFTSVSWITVAKKLSGTGSVGADLVGSANPDPFVQGATISDPGAFSVTSNQAPPLPLGSQWWDTAAALPSGTTGRLAGSALRMSLRLRDTISSLDATPTAFTSIGGGDEHFTEVTGQIHPDAQDETWGLSIVDAANNEVVQQSGTSSNPSLTWLGLDLAGKYVPDGVYTVNLTIEGFPNVLRQVPITLDSTGPVIPRFGILPRDHGNTMFTSQPLLARVTDAMIGVDASSIVFHLTDETDQANRITTSHPSTSYDPVTGWAKTSPVSLELNHTYTIRVEASDELGNFSTQSQRPVRDGGGFQVISADPQASIGSIADTPCSVSEPNPITQTREATCESVPLAVAPTTIDLSSGKRSAFGYVQHSAPLDAAVLRSSVLGQPVSQQAYAPGTTYPVPLRFEVDTPSFTPLTPAVAGATAEIGPLTADVPATWEAVSIEMPPQATSASLSACSDPAAEIGVVQCLPDPIWAIHEVVVDEAMDPQTVADLHAVAYGVEVGGVFDPPEGDHGYWAGGPVSVIQAIAGDPDTNGVRTSDPPWATDTVKHFEVRPPSGTAPGEAVLTCAWHSKCEDQLPGEALDWGGKTSSGGNTLKSFFRVYGWAYEQDASDGSLEYFHAPHQAGWIRTSDGPSQTCIEQQVQAIQLDDDPEQPPAERRWGAFFSHIETAAGMPDTVGLDAGQESFFPDGTGPPQFSRIRVGDEITQENCGGADHTHIDLTASTNNVAIDRFGEMLRNTRIPTWSQCMSQTNTTDCGSEFDMTEPEKAPPGAGYSMLALRAEHYPILWWEWVTNPCQDSRVLWSLCQILWLDAP